MNIGTAVRAYRIKNDLSRSELAEKAGIAIHTLESIEYGRAGTRTTTFCALAESIGMRPWELMKEAEKYAD